MCILEFATHITEYVGASQHGAGKSSGAAIMAERIDLLIDLDPSRLFIQVDIANASFSASWKSTLAALRDCVPELAMSQQSWLCALAQAVMTDPQGSRVILTTTNGIPQGDPLSSLAFACLLRNTTKTFLREWQKRVAAGLNVSAESAPGADVDMGIVEEDFGHAQLEGAPLKTVAYHPEGQGPLGGELLAVYASQPKRTDLVLCGLPIWSKQSGEEDGQAIPFGAPEFVADYLAAHVQVMEGRLRALTTLQDTR
eukprot:1901829-Amphidinium_carterae.1